MTKRIKGFFEVKFLLRNIINPPIFILKNKKINIRKIIYFVQIFYLGDNTINLIIQYAISLKT